MRKTLLVIFLAFLFLSLTPVPAQAICEGPIVPCGRSETPPCQLCHIFVLFNNIINYILTCLTQIITGLMLVIGGSYLLAAGLSPEKVNRARSIITGAVIGFVIIMISWVFLNTFFTYIGIAEWTGLGTWWEIKCEAPPELSSTCSDGTEYGQCSSNKPKYCDDGNLIDKCNECGCPSEYTCQIDESCILTATDCDSKCKSQRFASGSCKVGEIERLYVDGKYIKKGGEIVHLAGALFGPLWNEKTGTPGNPQAREKMFINMTNAGANYVSISINLALWKDPDYNNDRYIENVKAWVNWAVKYDMFFTLGLHVSAYEGEMFYDYGGTYKIVEEEPARTWAMEMYLEWAETWKDLPNFIGIEILNEPCGWKLKYDKWDIVTQFYLDVIDSVREVDPHCIFFVQAPYRTSGYPKEWVTGDRELLQREGVVLEFHQYYTYKLEHESEDWAVTYRDYGPDAGREAYEDWLLENIVSIRDEYNIPIFSGEYGVRLKSKAPEPDDIYALDVQEDKMQLFNEHEIHYTQWRIYAYKGHPFAMSTEDGNRFNLVGENWAKNLPRNLIRPSDPVGGCQPEETPIEDGCDSGFTCCCSGK